jgi:hypothetical protein
MPYLEAIDEFLLGKLYEPFTQWFQRLTGINTFWWARLTLTLLVIQIGIKGKLRGDNNLTLALHMSLIAGIFVVFSFPGTYLNEAECLRNSEKGFANSLRAYSKVRIISAIVMILLNSPYNSIFHYIDTTLWVSYVYFKSCNILPPGKSKVRKAIEKIVSLFRPQLATQTCQI